MKQDKSVFFRKLHLVSSENQLDMLCHADLNELQVVGIGTVILILR